MKRAYRHKSNTVSASQCKDSSHVVVSARRGLVREAERSQLVSMINHASRVSLAIEDVKVTDNQWAKIESAAMDMFGSVIKFA